MKKILIDKQDIKTAIIQGDNCDGSPVLIVAAEGNYRIGWNPNQGEGRFHESDLILPIPSLWPDGSGEEGIEARECIERNLPNLPGFKSLEEIEDYCEEQNISAAEFCEKFLAEDWQAQIENNLDFLLTNWLAAINEEPNDLYPDQDLYTSGLDDEGMPLHIKRRFKYTWKPGAPKGNQNAKKPERKKYQRIFGQRWNVEQAEAIKQYLDEAGFSQKEWLDAHLLPLIPLPQKKYDPSKKVEMQFHVSPEIYHFLKQAGLPSQALAKIQVDVNLRPCNCGSGLPWVTCPGNPPGDHRYCG